MNEISLITRQNYRQITRSVKPYNSHVVQRHNKDRKWCYAAPDGGWANPEPSAALLPCGGSVVDTLMLYLL